MVHKFTVEQKIWLKKVYPTLNNNWRKLVKDWYFKTHYNDVEQRNLRYLTKYYRHNDGKDWKSKIPLKDYL